eukprot:scaffold45391_cov75-Phaeocystis_antarctica.AAC.1
MEAALSLVRRWRGLQERELVEASGGPVRGHVAGAPVRGHVAGAAVFRRRHTARLLGLPTTLTTYHSLLTTHYSLLLLTHYSLLTT